MNKMNKRKQYNDNYIDEETNKLKKIKNIKNMIKKQEITMENIIDLDIHDDEKIWFYEQIKIMENMMLFTEERYLQKRLLYNKYTEITNNKFSCTEKNKKVEYLKNITNTNKDLLTRILESNHDDNTKAIMYKKYASINEMNTDEKYKMIEFIEIILEIPTEIKYINKNIDINTSLINLEKSLTKNIYGLYDTKERLMELYCGMLTNPEYKNRTIAFVGPAGVGKTAFAKTLAESFDLPFEQISMGSVKDASTLTGHSMTYIGAQVGLIVSAMRRLKYKNGIIFFDELDKVPNTTEGKSILSVLLHVLDKKQNNEFKDMYAPEIKVDLSNILFLVAMNDTTELDPILKDRLHIINIEGYNINDKINIARDYLLPKIKSNLSMKDNDLIINDDVLKYLIILRNYEGGVRQLELDLITICEKINIISNLSKIHKNKRIKLSYNNIIDDYKKPFYLSNNHINILLKK
jgi:ATP-dependent Lon protease